MSDVGVIVTGVVIGSASGILGAICGAWLTARSQMASLKLSISAEDKRARIAEKRKIYAQCVAALNSAWLGPGHINVADPDLIVARAREYKEMIRDCLNTVFEVALIAPDDIPDAAQDAVKGITRKDENGKLFPEAIDRLLRAMRIDLGEPPLPGKMEPLSPV
jgi:hypothetical protein